MPAEPFVRVDAHRLETALLALRHPIVSVPLLLEAPGVQEARAERRKLLSQIDDYLLPRLRQSGAPILIGLVGSTGAGKSTLMNSMVGKEVSVTGIRRPTTNSPVLACHPSDMHWFAENVFLPTLPRVRQQGLAMPGRDGLLVLATSEGMPQGVALLDTPDIDSVVQAHREFADQFLDAADMWLFVTTARRYADAAVWELLRDGRDRGAALAVVMSRVPPASAPELAAHFEAMLGANGLGDVQRFIIPETVITDARLPAAVSAPARAWLDQVATRDDRRVAVLTQTMSGVLDTFKTRIPALASQVEGQLTARQQLTDSATGPYAASLTEFDQSTRDGTLLRGEVLARWQDFAGAGDLLKSLQVRRGKKASGGRPKNSEPDRAAALQAALHASLASLVTSLADRAAEQAVGAWRRLPPGQALLAGLATGNGQAANGQSEGPDYIAAALADLGLAEPAENGAGPADVAALARSSPALAEQAAVAISGWQDEVLQLVQAENVTKRSVARVVSFEHEPLALVLTIGVLSYAAEPGPDRAAGSGHGGNGAAAVPQRLLTSLFGAGLFRDISTRVRLDLHRRMGVLLDSERQRFTDLIDAAGMPDESLSSQLFQAGYGLEEAR